MAKLLITLPNSRDIVHELADEVVTVGRLADNKIQINDDSVSGHHAKFIVSKGRFRLKDLGSTNKTCVNGNPVTEAVLTGSCIVRFGTVECMFKVDAAAAPASLATQLAEAQRQITALLRARDALHEQNLNVAKQRDALQLSTDDLADQLAEANAQKEAIVRERDEALARQKETPEKQAAYEEEIRALYRERDEAIERIDAIAQQLKKSQADLDAAMQAGEKAQKQADEISPKLSEQTERLAALEKERDALAEAERTLREQIALATKERDDAQSADTNARQELETIRSASAELKQANEKLAADLADSNRRREEAIENQSATAGEAMAKLDETERRLQQIAAERDDAKKIGEEVVAQRDEAKRELERLASEQEKAAIEAKNRVEELIAESLAANEAREKLAAECAAANQKINELTRDREVADTEIAGKFEAAQKRLEALAAERESERDATAKVAAELVETKRQLNEAIKNQNATVGEATKKLHETEQQLRVTTAQREAAKNAGEEIAARCEEANREIAKIADERKAETAETRKRIEELVEEARSADEARKSLATELATSKKTIDELTLNRDLAVGEIGQKFCEATRQIETLKTDRDSARGAASKLTIQVEESKRRIDQLLDERDAQIGEMSDQLSAALSKIDYLQTQWDAAKKAKDGAARTLEATRQQLDELIERSESVAAEAARKFADAETRASSFAEQLAAAKESGEKIAAQFHEAQREIENLRAAREEEQQASGRFSEELCGAQKEIEALRVESAESRKAREEMAARLETSENHASELVQAKAAEIDELACELSEIRKHFDATTRERDLLKQSGDRLLAELEEANQQIEESAKSREAEAAAVSAQAEETQKLLAAARAEIEAFSKQTRELRETIETHQKQIAGLTEERDRVEMTRQDLAAQCEQAKSEIGQLTSGREAMAGEMAERLAKTEQETAALRDERAATAEQSGKLLAEIEAQRQQLAALSAGTAAAKDAHETAIQQLAKAKRAAETLASEKAAELEAHAAKLRNAEQAIDDLQRERATLCSQNNALMDGAESHRQQIAEIMAERDAALQSARKPEFSVVENQQQPVPEQFEPIGGASPFGGGLRLASEPAKSGPATLTFSPPPLPVPEPAPSVQEPLVPAALRLDRKAAAAPIVEITDAAVRSILPVVPQTLATMRNTLQYFLRHPDDMKLVQQLSRSAQTITEKTSHIKTHPVHRLSTAIETFLRDFVKFPEQVNSGTLRSLGMGMDFLGLVLNERNIFRASHLPPATVFAVDDNIEVQREIVAAVMLLKVKIDCADTPTKTLEALSKQDFDLIFLDINLPEMTGLELCTKIRRLPGHRKTPIVFITGAGTPENRAQSHLKGGNDFITKPFDIAEIAVKTLTWVFKKQLELA